MMPSQTFPLIGHSLIFNSVQCLSFNDNFFFYTNTNVYECKHDRQVLYSSQNRCLITVIIVSCPFFCVQIFIIIPHICVLCATFVVWNCGSKVFLDHVGLRKLLRKIV